MRKIVAVYKKKKLKVFWGVIFDTDVQSYVEQFMQKMHISSHNYVLYFYDEMPSGVYTEVSVNVDPDKGVSFKI
jgi:hypothetical protein